jgi:hypothetical protein
MRHVILILFVSLLATSCTTKSAPNQYEETLAAIETTALAQIIETAVVKTATALSMSAETFNTPLSSTPKPQQTINFNTAIPTNDRTTDVMDCTQTEVYLGDTVTCKLDRSYCVYLWDVQHHPTYCYDAPYPNHSFTLLIWHTTWASEYDGHCIIVEGLVSLYEGKPRIVADSPSQVSFCP